MSRTVLVDPNQPRPDYDFDPDRLTVLPHLSAPIDQGTYIPKPKPSRWERLLKLILILALVIVGLGLLVFKGTFR